MKKTKVIMFRITNEYDVLLQEKAKASGFQSKSEYLRTLILRSLATEEKINKIYEKVCND